MKKILICGAVVSLALVGCGEQSRPDQCLRNALFMQCMQALPTGPQSTVTNDWAEVVDECFRSATYMSMRKSSTIPAECHP